MPIFFDTDLNFPSDDFQALMLLSSGRDDICGIGCAAGNTWSEEVFANISSVAHLLNAETNIYTGPSYTRFLSDIENFADDKPNENVPFFGAFSKSRQPRKWVGNVPIINQGNQAAKAIIELSREFEGSLTIVCTGPLTNLCDALAIDPSLINRVANTIVMGGFFGAPNEKRVDFNFWFHPSAADAVLNSGLKITLLPLDVCRTVHLTDSLIAQLMRVRSGQAFVFNDDLRGMIVQHGRTLAFCDQLAALVAIDSTLSVSVTRSRISVDSTYTPSRGRSDSQVDPESNVFLIREVDVHRSIMALTESVRLLGAKPNVAYQPLGTPRLRYVINECLANKHFYFVDCSYSGAYQLIDQTCIESTDILVERLAPLVKILNNAKSKGELWPPVPLFDAPLAGTNTSPSELEPELELVEYAWNRFRVASHIARIQDRSGSVRGFVCLSPLNNFTAQHKSQMYNHYVSEKMIVAEFGYVERGTCGPWALQYMLCQLILSFMEHRQLSTIEILAEVLSTQTTCIQVINSLGFAVTAEHTIPSGFEQGRTLRLYAASISRDKIKVLIKLYEKK